MQDVKEGACLTKPGAFSSLDAQPCVTSTERDRIRAEKEKVIWLSNNTENFTISGRVIVDSRKSPETGVLHE
jgi:hypothetical protein